MREAVYMVALRCLVLLTQGERALLVLVRRSTGLMRPENVFFSHRYELCAAFWLGVKCHNCLLVSYGR